ncbi:MAG TPA: hypothetical protein EYF95_08290 [Flavobacteriales bacterium]|jgi:hypothetical protein|nr:hypothetical protein [Flavobacteriales bacterium]
MGFKADGSRSNARIVKEEFGDVRQTYTHGNSSGNVRICTESGRDGGTSLQVSVGGQGFTLTNGRMVRSLYNVLRKHYTE